MKVRTGFVTNSSSTSFIIISPEALTREAVYRLLSIHEGSPLAPIAECMWEKARRGTTGRISESSDIRDELEYETKWFGEEMKQRLQQAETDGAMVTIGRVDSSGSPYEQYICMTGFSCESGDAFVWAERNGW